MARLHWFWRAAIAVVIGFGAGSWLVRRNGPNEWAEPLWTTWVLPLHQSDGFPMAGLLLYVPVLLVAFCTYGLLTRWLGSKAPAAGETYCRKCGYILRGISEPRCPECGERI